MQGRGTDTASGGQHGAGQGRERLHLNHHTQDDQVSGPQRRIQQQLSKCMGGGKGVQEEMKDGEEGNQWFFQRPLGSPPTRAPRKIRQKKWTAAKTQSTKGGTYTRMKGTKRQRQTEAWGGKKGHTAPDGYNKLQEQEQTLKKTKKVPRAVPKNTDYSLRQKSPCKQGRKPRGPRWA